VRNLDNTSRQVQATLQQTKLRAIDTKVLHRIRFYQSDGGYWVYEMERFQPDGRGSGSRSPRKTILQTLEVTMALPVDGSDPSSSFPPSGPSSTSPSSEHHRLPEPKLLGMNQDDERVISLFMGGSIQYAGERAVDMKRHKRQDGFSLMEVLVGIFLVGVASSGWPRSSSSRSRAT